MKKFLTLLFSICILFGCSKEDPIVTQINFESETMTLLIGSSTTLSIIYSPSELVAPIYSWQSSDNDIVSVTQSGEILALEVGNATITVTTEAGLTTSCIVTVSPIEATSIKLIENELTIEETESVLLRATISPSNATNCDIMWMSSDTSIATVDDGGNVTGVRIGTATITATTVDGGYSASCDVTVTEVGVKSIDLEWKSIKLAIGETYKLISTISPYNAANQNVLWSSSSPSVLSVDSDGNLTALSRGNTTISVKSEDGDFYANCDVEVKPIDEYLVLDATLGSTSMSGTFTTFQLNDRLYNPTSLPITIDSYFFIKDSSFEFATGYPGGEVINKGEYKYNLFENNVYISPTTSVSWTDFVVEVARYSIRYYITCGGNSYTLEQSYKGNSSSNLNKVPTISDWWE